MSQQLPALLIIAPLIGACLIFIAGWTRRALCYPLAMASLVVALGSAIGVLHQVLLSGPLIYRLGGWDPPWGIAYSVDALNALVLVVVSAVALINLVASRPAIDAQPFYRIGAFYSLYILSVTGMMGMVITGDVFNLYVLLEIASLTGYALVGMGEDRAPLSALNYVLLGTIGASFYLLGVGFLYAMTGTLNMADIALRLPALYGSTAVFAAFVMIMVGIWLKAAFFPLHSWLPNAYTYASSPASGLLAPLMTKVMIYVMIRMMLTVFTPAYSFSFALLNQVVVWLAVIAIVAGAVMALAAKDFKRMLTYIIVSEVGYMVGGAWLGNRLGMTGSMLHLVNDAAMTLCVFLVAAAFASRLKDTKLKSLKGLFKTMPFTMGALVLGGLSIIGVPPTCGFFSKWYLISAGIQAGAWGYIAALLFSSLVNLVLFFRVFEIAYFEPFSAHGHGHDNGGHGQAAATAIREAPAQVVVPLIITAVGLIALGLYSKELVSGVIALGLPPGLR
jgi:multicomponent Na+:H+ antiporter subunit D